VIAANRLSRMGNKCLSENKIEKDSISLETSQQIRKHKALSKLKGSVYSILLVNRLRKTVSNLKTRD